MEVPKTESKTVPVADNKIREVVSRAGWAGETLHGDRHVHRAGACGR